MSEQSEKRNVPVAIGKEAAPAPAVQMQNEFDRMFERLFGSHWPTLMRWPSTSLSAGLFETPELRMPKLESSKRCKINELALRWKTVRAITISTLFGASGQCHMMH